MRRQQTKQCEAWRRRREQYLRESGRHVDLIKEGYASADSTENWIVVVGGRPRGSLERNPGMRLLLVKERRLDLGVQSKKAVDQQPEASAPQSRSRGGAR
jgi:hypothetical protein